MKVYQKCIESWLATSKKECGILGSTLCNISATQNQKEIATDLIGYFISGYFSHQSPRKLQLKTFDSQSQVVSFKIDQSNLILLQIQTKLAYLLAKQQVTLDTCNYFP